MANAIYETKHRGCAIVCGAAPSLFADLEEARLLRPQADIYGCNNTAALVPEIEHVWTHHHTLAGQYKRDAKRPIFVHGNTQYPDIDYFWPAHWICGSSGVGSALWARWLLGYDEVIMCGIPLTPESKVYVDGYPSKPMKNSQTEWADDGNFNTWHRQVLIRKDEGRFQGITSMSGWTRETFGAPK